MPWHNQKTQTPNYLPMSDSEQEQPKPENENENENDEAEAVASSRPQVQPGAKQQPPQGSSGEKSHKLWQSKRAESWFTEILTGSQGECETRQSELATNPAHQWWTFKVCGANVEAADVPVAAGKRIYVGEEDAKAEATES